MLHYGIILVVILASGFTFLSFILNDYFRKVITTSMSIILWLGAAAGSPSWKIPYSKVVENSVVTGTYQIEGAVSWLSFVWIGFAIIMFIYLFASVAGQSKEAWKKRGNK